MTDKFSVSQEVRDSNNNFEPTYFPLFAIFTKREALNETIGSVTFKETDILGNVETDDILSQDTERAHLKSGEKSKIYNKYVKGVTYRESGFQIQTDKTKITNKVINKLMKQFDNEVFYGDDKKGAMRNNGLFNSNDVNYVTETAITSFTPTLVGVKDLIDNLLLKSDNEAGNGSKIVIPYGESFKKFFNSLSIQYSSPMTTASILEGAYDGRLQIIPTPSGLEKASQAANVGGLLMVSPEVVMFRYNCLPRLWKSGANEEYDYTWYSFLTGSSQVDVETSCGIIKQPLTLA